MCNAVATDINVLCYEMACDIHEKVAVCNLASIALPRFVEEDKSFNYQKLYLFTDFRFFFFFFDCSVMLACFSAVTMF